MATQRFTTHPPIWVPYIGVMKVLTRFDHYFFMPEAPKGRCEDSAARYLLDLAHVARHILKRP